VLLQYGWRLEAEKQDFYWEALDKDDGRRSPRWTSQCEYVLDMNTWHTSTRQMMVDHLSKTAVGPLPGLIVPPKT
jgi:hypothetical protein